MEYRPSRTRPKLLWRSKEPLWCYFLHSKKSTFEKGEVASSGERGYEDGSFTVEGLENAGEILHVEDNNKIIYYARKRINKNGCQKIDAIIKLMGIEN